VALTCEFHDTLRDRLCRDSAFFEAMLDEVVMAIVNREQQVARLILDDLSSCPVNF
jgi:hypothetical protein